MAGVSLLSSVLAGGSIGASPLQGISIGATQVWTAIPPLAFDAVGAGLNVRSASGSFIHTAADGAGLLVFVYAVNNSTPTISVTFGASTVSSLMTPLKFKSSSFSNFGAVFGLLGVSGGAKSVAVSVSGGTTSHLWGQSLSYVGATNFGAPQTTTGDSSSYSQTATSATGHIVAQAFFAGTGSIGSYNQTQRWLDPTNFDMVVGDAAGAASVPFSATSGLDFYGGIAVDVS